MTAMTAMTTAASESVADPDDEQAKRHQRAKARWSILRTALLSKDAPHLNAEDASEGGSASIHRFPGFNLLGRTVINDEQIRTALHRSEGESRVEHECAEYSVRISAGDGGGGNLIVRTRERVRSARKLGLKALTSHRHYGVDNTGNARVWDSESTITHCLLRSGISSDVQAPLGVENVLAMAQADSGGRKFLRVVELGAGMAGLAGLSLAALHLLGLSGGVKIDVTLTDGHPDCIANNEVCVDLTTSLYPNRVGSAGVTAVPQSPRCRRLLWRSDSAGAMDCALLTEGGKFHLCLASDCTHFTEFHAALAVTIGRLLSVGGQCLLCQPRRGTSLQKFVALVDAMNVGENGPLFRKRMLDDYDPVVTRMHKEHLASEERENRGIYDPNIHYPLLLILTKGRGYDEAQDTGRAVQHLKDRDAIEGKVTEDV